MPLHIPASQQLLQMRQQQPQFQPVVGQTQTAQFLAPQAQQTGPSPAIGAASTGATIAAGAAGGPLAAAGVAAGTQLIGGLLSQRAAAKRQKAQIQSQALANIGQIRQAEGQQVQAGINQIVANLRNAFTF